MSDTSYEAKITDALVTLFDTIPRQRDVSNHAPALAEAFFWDVVERVAKKRSEAAWDDLTDLYDKETAPVGDSVPLKTDHFAIVMRKTAPIKRFDADVLAELLHKSKYKVPIMTAKDLIQKAKVPKSPSVTLSIVET